MADPTEAKHRRWFCPPVNALLLALVLAAACTSGDTPDGRRATATPSAQESGEPTPSDPPEAPLPAIRPGEREFDAVDLRLVQIAKLSHALALTTAPGEDALYVAQRNGLIRVIRDGQVEKEPVLDISDRVGFDTPGANGLLSIAFDPQGRHLYVSYSDSKGDSHLDEYRWDQGQVVLESRRELFSIKLTTIAHRGGHILFGPDGYLWFGMGDGSLLEGGEKVQGDPKGQAQTLDNWNGKMLRLDPNPSEGHPYSIPQDNPYADKKGTRPEIYLSGMRNPWRFSFDRRTDDLWIGDVGQYILEEIDFLPKARPAGGNLGWNRLEGTLEFQGSPPPDAISPLHVYNHNDGRCVVVGGYTYRGRLIEGLHGAYLYGDFCDGRIRALVQKKGRVLYEREDLGLQVDGLIAFGEDSEGELYAVSLSKGVFRIAPRRP